MPNTMVTWNSADSSPREGLVNLSSDSRRAQVEGVLAEFLTIPMVESTCDHGITITTGFKKSQNFREAAKRARRVVFKMYQEFAAPTL